MTSDTKDPVPVLPVVAHLYRTERRDLEREGACMVYQLEQRFVLKATEESTKLCDHAAATAALSAERAEVERLQRLFEDESATARRMLDSAHAEIERLKQRVADVEQASKEGWRHADELDQARKEAEAEIERLRQQLAEEQAAREHAQQWYAVRWEELKRWAREDIGDSARQDFFSIIANGVPTTNDPPEFATLLNAMRHRAEAAEAALQAERERVQGLEKAGGMLSNIAYNLAQWKGEVLTEQHCKSLDQSRRAWDDAMKKDTSHDA